MTAPAAARATLTPLVVAKFAWAVANRRERMHADHCLKLALGYRCPTCLDLEAAQNRAADAVTRARRGISR